MSLTIFFAHTLESDPKTPPKKFRGQGWSGSRDMGDENFQGGWWEVISTDDEAQAEGQKFRSPISPLPDHP